MKRTIYIIVIFLIIALLLLLLFIFSFGRKNEINQTDYSIYQDSDNRFNINTEDINSDFNDYVNEDIIYLEISSNEKEIHLEDYDFRTIFPNVEYATIEGEDVKNIYGINNFNHLTTLTLSGTNIESIDDIDGILELNSLQRLDIDNTNFDTIEGIEKINWDSEGFVLSVPYNCKYISNSSYDFLNNHSNTVWFVKDGITVEKTESQITKSATGEVSSAQFENYYQKTYDDLERVN